MSSKFSRNIKGGISSIANWSGGKSDDENEEPQAFGDKLRHDMEVAAAKLPIQEIELESLVDNPYQYLARRSYDDSSTQELVDSIKNNGFYGALLARRKAGAVTKFEVAYGHRRKDAAARAGLKTIPVKIVELNDTEMARIMASENFSRLDLSPSGEAEVLGFLADHQNLSAKEISGFVGKKRGWVEKRLALYNAPQLVKNMVEQKPETFSHVPLLLRFKETPDVLQNLTTRTITENLTYQQLKDIIHNELDQNRDSTNGNTNTNTNGNTNTTIVTNLTTSTLSGNSDKTHNSDDATLNLEESLNTVEVGMGVTKSTVNNLALPKLDVDVDVDAPSNNVAKVVTSSSSPPEKPVVETKVSKTVDDTAALEIEAELLKLEEFSRKLTNRNPESLSWSHRARIQRVSQALKEIVGGD